MQAGTVHLAAGSHTIQVSSDGSSPLSKFFSLEFVRPQVRESLAALGSHDRASTSWMVAANYGLMFHWTSQSMPREGPPQNYCDAVRKFDVEKFANMVSKRAPDLLYLPPPMRASTFPALIR